MRVIDRVHCDTAYGRPHSSPAFRTGFAEIPLGHVIDIVDVQVWEGDQAYTQGGYGAETFSIDRERDSIFVEWEYEPTSGVEVRTFTVGYRVMGGLWIYPDRDLVSWTVVPKDRGGIPVETSRVTVRLPAPVESADLTITSYGVEETLEITSTRMIVFEAPYLPVSVVTNGDQARGMTIVDWMKQTGEPANVHIVTELKNTSVFDMLGSALR